MSRFIIVYQDRSTQTFIKSDLFFRWVIILGSLFNIEYLDIKIMLEEIQLLQVFLKVESKEKIRSILNGEQEIFRQELVIRLRKFVREHWFGKWLFWNCQPIELMLENVPGSNSICRTVVTWPFWSELSFIKLGVEGIDSELYEQEMLLRAAQTTKGKIVMYRVFINDRTESDWKLNNRPVLAD